jgi:hypothetical protein
MVRVCTLLKVFKHQKIVLHITLIIQVEGHDGVIHCETVSVLELSNDDITLIPNKHLVFMWHDLLS